MARPMRNARKRCPNGPFAPLALVALLTAIAGAAPAARVGDLGAGLLDEELARALQPEPAPQQPTREGGNFLPDAETLGRLLQQGAPAGEDLGRSPLTGVAQDMRRAEGLITDERDGGAAVPVQRDVVKRLDDLIAKMEKQCQGGACNKPKPGDSKKQASRRSQPKPGECKNPGACDKPSDQASASKAAKPGGSQANRSGTTTLGAAQEADAPAGQDLMKAAWGNLPERVRERMLQGAGAEFLPEYRDELELYYRRLAERPSQGAP